MLAVSRTLMRATRLPEAKRKPGRLNLGYDQASRFVAPAGLSYSSPAAPVRVRGAGRRDRAA